MSCNNYFLRSKKYSVVNLMTGGFSRNHIKCAVNSTTWKGRIVHTIAFAIQRLPVIGLIVSVFEYTLAKLLQNLNQPNFQVEAPLRVEIEELNHGEDRKLVPLMSFISEELYHVLNMTKARVKEGDKPIITIADVNDALKKFDRNKINEARSQADMKDGYFIPPKREPILLTPQRILEVSLKLLQSKNLIAKYETAPSMTSVYTVTMP